MSPKFAPRSLIGLAIVVFIATVFGVPCAVAQEEDDRPAAAESIPSTLRGPIRIRDLGGQVVAEPVEVAPALPGDVPPFFLSKLEFQGVVIENRAEISAEIHISVTRDGLWQDVPLRMPEARVIKAEYEGNGQQAPVVTADRGDGLIWKFRGAGQHKLFLELEVPLERSPEGQRLGLTLPKLPKLFSGKLTLILPDAPLNVTGEGIDIRQSVTPNGQTTVEATVPGIVNPGSGTRLGVTWSSRTSVKPGTIASCETNMSVRLDEDESLIRLEARQRVRGADRKLSVVRMTIPAGFEVDDVTGPRYVERQSYVGVDGKRLVEVQLDGESGDAELVWLLSRPMEGDEASFSIDEFAIEDAARHTGTIVLDGVDGYRTSVDWDDVLGARRATPTTPNGVSAVYFFREPLLVPVRIRKERPSITVAPVAELTLTDSEALLISTFSVDVDRGRVDELTLQWANGESGEWDTLSVEQPIGAELIRGDSTSVIRLSSSRTESFKVVLAGQRTLAQDESSLVALPRMLAEVERPTRLRVYASDSVEAEVSADGESRLVDISPSGGRSADLTTEVARLVGTYDVRGEPASLDVRRSIRESVLSADTTLELRPMSMDSGTGLGVGIEQTIDVEVAFGRRSDLRLGIPEVLRGDVSSDAIVGELRFEIDGQPLPSRMIEPAGDGVIRLLLERPRSRFSVKVLGYPLPIERLEDGQWEIPVISALPVDYETVRVRVRRDGLFSVVPSVSDAGAKPLDWARSPVSTPGSVTWVLSDVPKAVSSFPAKVETGVSNAATLFGVTQAEVRFSREGEAYLVRADYRIEDVSGAVVIGLPPESESPRFTWNTRAVGEREVVFGNDATAEAAIDRRDRTAGMATYRIPTGADSSGTLIVQYRLPADPAGLVAHDTLGLPRLPRNVWVDQSLIEVILSGDRHLLRTPTGLTGFYSWVRRGLLWSRVSRETLSFPVSDSATAGNRYLFTAAVVPTSFEVASVQGSSLILGGAATTFFLSFMLYQFPQLRRLPVFLGLGVLISFAGVYQPEVMQLLMQPAILGVMLSLFAVAIDSMRQRPTNRGTYLAVVSESEFSTGGFDQAARSDSRVSETAIGVTSPSAANQ